jgi:adenylate kinase
MLGAIPGFFHLATGDMFRSLDKESEIGLEFTRYSSQGLLVPDFLTVRLWKQHVEQLTSRELYNPSQDTLLLDGIPRSEPQAEMMAEYIDPFMIIHLVCEDIDEMVRRMQKRATEQGRPDDADESIIRKRFEVYREQTAPVLAYYNDEIIANIDALGTQAEVLLRILSKVVPALK